MEAYRLIGYQCDRDMSHIDRDRTIQGLRRDFSTLIADELRRLRASVSFDWQSQRLTVNDTLTIRTVVARCRPLGDSHGWLLRLRSLRTPDVTVIGRLSPDNRDFLDYLLLKPKNTRGLTQVTLSPGKDLIFEKYRYDDLSFLKSVVRWSKTQRARRSS